LKSGTTSKGETVSQSQVLTATATIEQARAAVEQAELNLSHCKNLGPEDGRVMR